MIVLARHGETPYNAEGRFQGHLPVPLTARGREQAAELARAAAQRTWAALVVSPLERAQETAAIVAAAIGLPPVTDARLAETDTGDWTGRSFAEVDEREPERFAAWQRGDLDFAYPGGESYPQQTARVMAALSDVRAGPSPALVICHRQVIRLALVAATGDAALGTSPIANGALVELPCDARGVVP